MMMPVINSSQSRMTDFLRTELLVGILNGCDYSLTNHFANARHLIADEKRADRILAMEVAVRVQAGGELEVSLEQRAAPAGLLEYLFPDLVAVIAQGDTFGAQCFDRVGL